MKFPSPLHEAILLKRHKKFLADIILANQQKHTIYCPNANSLVGCNILGSRIWFSRNSNPNKTYQDTWELVEVEGGRLICINHHRAKQVILDGIATNVIAPLSGYQHILSDVKYNNQTFDFLLSEYPHFNNKEKLADLPRKDNCFVVVQNVTLGDEIGRGFYPDTEDKKIAKQLAALIEAKEMGYRAVWVYCVMNTCINKIFPADHINADFGCLLRQAVIRGVEVMAYQTHITLEEMVVTEPVEVCIPARMLYTPRSEKSG